MMRFLVALLVAIAVCGCARFPSGGGGARTTRLIFTFTLAQAVNQNFVYIVALRPSTEDSPTTQGPIPVIAPPWGNGFVAGNCTHFVRWDVTQAPDYLLYAFQDPDLLNYIAVGIPVSYHLMEPGDRTFRFELDLTQIVPEAMVDNYKSIQINFLTMDNVPQGQGGSKIWDALGDGRTPGGINQYITLPLKVSGFYDNARFQDLEPNGDCVDPSLDMIDWSVEIRPR